MVICEKLFSSGKVSEKLGVGGWGVVACKQEILRGSSSSFGPVIPAPVFDFKFLVIKLETVRIAIRFVSPNL